MVSFVQLFLIDQTTSTGSMIFYSLKSFKVLVVVMKAKLKALTLAQEPIAFILSSVHPFLVGVLLDQVSFLLHLHCFFCFSMFSLGVVNVDITDVALEWAEKNVKSNPHISDLIEIRGSKVVPHVPEVENRETEEAGVSPTVQSDYLLDDNKSYMGPAVLLGVVKENENFDFCMSNPPFFETFEEAGLNPKTSCGGTPAEMVCSGGEQAFVTRIIEDSAVLRQRFR